MAGNKELEDQAGDSSAGLSNPSQVSLDLNDLEEIAYFGKKPQQGLSRTSRKMLKAVTEQGVVKASGSLESMLAVITGFDIRAYDPNQASPWGRLMDRLMILLTGRPKGLKGLLDAIGQLVSQVEHIALELERHKTALLTEIVAMDRLVDQCHRGLEELKLFREQAKSLLEAPISEQARYHLLQRTEDLTLSAQVGQQSLATLDFAQRSSRALMARINQVLEITVPLWQQHMTQLVAIWRQDRAREALRVAAQGARDAAAVAAEMAASRDRVQAELASGRYDLSAIEAANQELQKHLHEGLQLSSEIESAQAQAATLLQQDAP